MKKTYKSPNSKYFRVETESLIASSPLDGGSSAFGTDKVDASNAMTRQQQSLWDNWSE